ncbi:MAG: hypothetical protein ALECFALPRED_007420, partial [Alectoria fallacina]
GNGRPGAGNRRGQPQEGVCVCDFNVCAKEVAELVAHAEMRVRKETADRVERDGWGALRAWVVGGGGCQSGL